MGMHLKSQLHKSVTYSSIASRVFLSQYREQNTGKRLLDIYNVPTHEGTLQRISFMMSEDKNTIAVDGELLDLRNRPLAALLAWLIPGAGHYYQGRTTKAGIFFICILSTWILGFAVGGSHVVYSSWQPGDKRWHFYLQAGAGLVALPAYLQGRHMDDSTNEYLETYRDYEPLWNGFMAPPFRPVEESSADEVAAWYAEYGAGYEMGTWYTVIAGLLNILVIYDAYGGPLAIPISGRKQEESPENNDETASKDDSANSRS